jgi:hypothetical protein
MHSHLEHNVRQDDGLQAGGAGEARPQAHSAQAHAERHPAGHRQANAPVHGKVDDRADLLPPAATQHSRQYLCTGKDKGWERLREGYVV